MTLERQLAKGSFFSNKQLYMKNFRIGLMGGILLLIGISLFIFIVPTVKANDLGFKEYFLAIIIIFSTCMGFGLLMTAILDGEE